jgi:hypothetical protein
VVIGCGGAKPLSSYDMHHGSYNPHTGVTKNTHLCDKPACEDCKKKKIQLAADLTYLREHYPERGYNVRLEGRVRVVDAKLITQRAESHRAEMKKRRINLTGRSPGEFARPPAGVA